MCPALCACSALSVHSDLACRCMKSLGVAQGAAQRGRDRVGDRTTRQTVRALHAGKSLDCLFRPICTRACMWPTVAQAGMLMQSHAGDPGRTRLRESRGPQSRGRGSAPVSALSRARVMVMCMQWHRHASMRTHAHTHAHKHARKHTRGILFFLLNQVRAAARAQGGVGRHGHLFRGTPHPQPVCLCPGLPPPPHPPPTQRMEEGWCQATTRIFFDIFGLGIGSSSAWRRGDQVSNYAICFLFVLL